MYSHVVREQLFFPTATNASLIDLSQESFKLPNGWAWPALDIVYFYSLNRAHVHEQDRSTCTFVLEDVFPHTYRPFGSSKYPAPRRPLQFSKRYYGLGSAECLTHWRSHATEKYMKVARMPCANLTSKYPFVQRWPHTKFKTEMGLVDEYLVYGNKIAFHSIKSLMSVEDVESTLFTAAIKGFKCPYS